MSNETEHGLAYAVSAIQWDFRYQPAKLGHHLNGYTHEDDKMDIYMTKDGVDMDKLAYHSLFNVGGYFHYHESNGDGIYIEDGFKSVKNLNTPHVGILNFEDVGGVVNIYKLKENQLYAPPKVKEIHETIYITLPEGMAVQGLVGLSLCGELYWAGYDRGIVSFVSPTCIKVNLKTWGLLQKVYHLKGKFGRETNMGLVPYKDGRISTEEVRRPEFIKMLFQLPQTFLISVASDVPLHLEYWDVASHQLPWKYECHAHRHQPLRLSDGRYTPYISQKHEFGYVLITEENRWYPQVNDTISRETEPYLVEMNISSRKGLMRHAQFAYIYREGERPTCLSEWNGDNRLYEDLLNKDITITPEDKSKESPPEYPEGIPQMSHNIHICGKGWYYQDEGSFCVEAKHLFDFQSRMFNTGDFLMLTPSEQLSFIEGIYLDGNPYIHGPRFYEWDATRGFIPEKGVYIPTKPIIVKPKLPTPSMLEMIPPPEPIDDIDV